MSDSAIPNVSLKIDESDAEHSLVGLTHADAKVMIQIIDRLAMSGKIQGPELLPIGVVRKKLVSSLSTFSKPTEGINDK